MQKKKKKSYFSKLVITLFSTFILFLDGNFSDNSVNNLVVEQVRCLFLESYRTIKDVLERPVMVTSKISLSFSSFCLSVCNF